MQLAAFLMRPCEHFPGHLDRDDTLIATGNGLELPTMRVAAFLMRPRENPAQREIPSQRVENREAAPAPQRQVSCATIEHERSRRAAPPRRRTLDDLSVGFVVPPSSRLAIALVCLLWIAALAGAGTAGMCIARDIAGPQWPSPFPAHYARTR